MCCFGYLCIPDFFEIIVFYEVVMDWNIGFFVTSAMLGIGLAMDAFSVSLANGLHEPKMCRCRMAGIAGVFAFFQALMPLLGWLAVHTFLEYFEAAQKFIPWIALALLGFIGGKMLVEGLRGCDEEDENCGCGVGFGALMVQGIATSIDALSVGFTIAEYDALHAAAAALTIAALTFVICIGGLMLGKKFGTRLAGKASVLGGVILIAIGIEIFITGIL